MRLSAHLDAWKEALLGFVYPPMCQICGTLRAGPREGYVCGACFKRVRFVQRPFCEVCGKPFEGNLTTVFECANCRGGDLHFSKARSAVFIKDIVMEAIHRYKYGRAMWLEPFLAGLLTAAAAPELRGNGWDAIVPVPLHPTKERDREFNQAERLAAELSKATGIPLHDSWLRRVEPTRSQTMLSRPERAENVRRAFAVSPGVTLGRERIVLVDDVFTTGATTNACARALKRAGAGEVCVWTVARGI